MGFYEKQQPPRIFHQKKKKNQDVFNKMVFNFLQECNGMLSTVPTSVFAGKIPRFREDVIS
jgi:hypothetical protein